MCSSDLDQTSTERREVAGELFAKAFVLEFEALSVTLERAKRLVELRLPRAQVTLPLLLGGALTFDPLLLLGQLMHEAFAFVDGNVRRVGATDEFAALDLQRRTTRLETSAFLRGPSDPSRRRGNACITSSTGDLPGAQRLAVSFDSGGDRRSPLSQLANAILPLVRRSAARLLLRARLKLCFSRFEVAKRIGEAESSCFEFGAASSRRGEIAFCLGASICGAAHDGASLELGGSLRLGLLFRGSETTRFAGRLSTERGGSCTAAFELLGEAPDLRVEQRVFGLGLSCDDTSRANHRPPSGDDDSPRRKVVQRIQRRGNRWRDGDPREDAPEDAVWIADDLIGEAWERRMIGDLPLCGPIDQERTLLVVEQRRTASIDDESPREGAEGGKDGAASLLANLHTGQEAPSADRASGSGKRTLLERTPARLERGEST